MSYLLMFLLFVTALVLILLVLIQRGKGGGLAGALGGMGGQSAFGTKAGDLFTRVTIGVAAFWIILCMVTVKLMGVGSDGPLDTGLGGGAKDRSGVTAPPSTDKKTDQKTVPASKPVPESPAKPK